METKVDENGKSIPATLTPTPLACFLMDNPLLWADCALTSFIILGNLWLGRESLGIEYDEQNYPHTCNTFHLLVHFLFENYSVSVNFDSFEALNAGRFSRRRYLDVCLLERSKKRWEAEEDRQRGRESSEPPSFNRRFLYLSLSYVLTWTSSRVFGEPKERRWESQRKERRRT